MIYLTYKSSPSYKKKVYLLKSLLSEFDHEGLNVLEIGGGGGGLTRDVFRNGKIISTDANEECVPYVDVVCNACNIPFKENSFDIVTLFDVLEHIKTDTVAVKETRRVLKNRGYVAIMTPNNPWRYPSISWAKELFESPQNLMERWGHVKEGYNQEQLKELFSEFETISIKEAFKGKDSLLYDLKYLKTNESLKSKITKSISFLPEFLFKGLESKAIMAVFQNEK